MHIPRASHLILLTAAWDRVDRAHQVRLRSKSSAKRGSEDDSLTLVPDHRESKETYCDEGYVSLFATHFPRIELSVGVMYSETKVLTLIHTTYEEAALIPSVDVA